MESIFEKLLGYYIFKLSKLPEGFYAAKAYLERSYMDKGICHCALNRFNDSVYADDKVINYIPSYEDYWGKTPSKAENIEEIKEAIQLRINILDEIVNKK